jgi:hypothetical protein
MQKEGIMSNPIQNIPTPTGEFQAYFGGPPSSDLAAECKKWETLCGELLAEREKLRGQLAQVSTEYEACKKSLFHIHCKDYQPAFTKADVADALTKANEKPTVRDIIDELTNAQG